MTDQGKKSSGGGPTRKAIDPVRVPPQKRASNDLNVTRAAKRIPIGDDGLNNKNDDNRSVPQVTNQSQLSYFLQSKGLDEFSSSILAGDIWREMTIHFVSAGANIVDPVTGLRFPPRPLMFDYRRRPYRPDGSGRISIDEYLADDQAGWGFYTQKNAMTSFWLSELDNPAYMAALHAAQRSADTIGLPKKSAERSRFIDDYFLARGIMTTSHLINPPPGLEWQAKLLNYVRKLQGKDHKGKVRTPHDDR